MIQTMATVPQIEKEDIFAGAVLTPIGNENCKPGVMVEINVEKQYAPKLYDLAIHKESLFMDVVADLVDDYLATQMTQRYEPVCDRSIDIDDFQEVIKVQCLALQVIQ